MRLVDVLLTRRREQPLFADLPPRVRRRLMLACRELTDAEEAIARELNLPTPPRLLMVDEEEAVVLRSGERAELLQSPDVPR